MNETVIQRVCTYPMDPRDSKITSDIGLVNVNNGSKGRTHCVCFFFKIKITILSNLHRLADNMLNLYPTLYLNQILIRKKVQNKNSRFCGSYCFYFLNVKKRMVFYDAILKMYFAK